MNDFEFSNSDESDLYENFRVVASHKDNKVMMQRVNGSFIRMMGFDNIEEQIGEVTLRKDIVQNDMPFELEINGVTYTRED